MTVTAWAVALMPFVVPPGLLHTAPADLFIAAAILAGAYWAGSTHQRIVLPYVVPVALLILGGAIGAMAGPVPVSGMVALVQDVSLVAWCGALVAVCRTPRGLNLVLATWAWTSIIWAGLLFLSLAIGNSFLSGETAREGSRAALTFGDPNYAANYFFISIMIIWATGRPRSRLMRKLAYALLVAALVSTGSNSGIVSLLIGTSVAGLLTVYSRFGAQPAIAALSLLILVGYLVVPHVHLADIQRAGQASRFAIVRDGIGRSGQSIEQRDLLLHESIALFYDGGVLGRGPTSTKPRLLAAHAPFVKEAHDDYLGALLERGVIGLLGLLLLVSSITVRTWPLITRRLSPGFAAVAPRLPALVGAIAGTLVAGTVYELLHVRHVWALFAIVASLQLWGSE